MKLQHIKNKGAKYWEPFIERVNNSWIRRKKLPHKEDRLYYRIECFYEDLFTWKTKNLALVGIAYCNENGQWGPSIPLIDIIIDMWPELTIDEQNEFMTGILGAKDE